MVGRLCVTLRSMDDPQLWPSFDVCLFNWIRVGELIHGRMSLRTAVTKQTKKQSYDMFNLCRDCFGYSSNTPSTRV